MTDFKEGDYIEFKMSGKVSYIYSSLDGDVVSALIKQKNNEVQIFIENMLDVKIIPEPLKVGDLCWGWDDEKSQGTPGVLTSMEDNDGVMLYRLKGGLWYRHSEKLPDDLAEKLKEYWEVEK